MDQDALKVLIDRVAPEPWPAEVFRNAVKEVSEQVRKTLTDVQFWAGKRA